MSHVTRSLGHHSQGQKVKGQLAGGGGILWRPPAQLVPVAVRCLYYIVYGIVIGHRAYIP